MFVSQNEQQSLPFDAVVSPLKGIRLKLLPCAKCFDRERGMMDILAILWAKDVVIFS